MELNHANIAIAGESNTGLNRSHNEDNFLICCPPGGAAVLALIADGIGGHAQGEIASYICCREVFKAAKQTDPTDWDAGFLRQALLNGNRRIFDRNLSELRERPMGCTVAAAVFHRDHFIVANAGDSRVYEYIAGAETPLNQLSVDHRPQIREGRRSRKKREHLGLITRSLGTCLDLELELNTFDRDPRARFLLCSDGLYSGMPESVLAGLLGSELPVRQVTGKLMREALLSGSHDNISIICAGPQEVEQ